MKSTNIFFIILATTFSSLPSSHSQNSVIETSLSLRPTIVTVQAIQYKDKTVRQGAGIFVNQAGTVMTNFHTINNADQIHALLNTNKKLPMKVYKLFPREDLVLLRPVAPFQSPSIHISNSNALQLKQTVFHIGHSYILDGTISQGQITGLGTSQAAKQKGQHDIAIIRVNLNVYKGDSGGPLINQKGQLIGMMVAKDNKKDRTSYAIPSNKIKNILSEITD